MYGFGRNSRRLRSFNWSTDPHLQSPSLPDMDEYRIRVQIFVGIILVALTILGLRLVNLQIVDASEYTGASRSTAVREKRVIPARGAVVDRNGVILVDNEPSYTITLTPRHFNPGRAGLLAQLLGVPDSLVVARLQEARARSAYQPHRAFREVPFPVFSRVVENLYRLPGVAYEIEQRRRYPARATAAHALGYIREIADAELERMKVRNYRQGDLVGKTGVEKQYEEYLRGNLGSEFKLVNIHGLEVEAYRQGQEDVPPVSGHDLYLHMDSRVQALAESLFVGKRGGAVAIDPKTGGIIAMVSKPDYDPELFTQAVDAETWNYLTASKAKPMLNRATMNLFPPGSTWKPFMALMSLQEGNINLNSRVHCPGGHPLGGGRFFRCMKVHGSLNVIEAIQASCNTFFFEMMMRTNVNTFSKYAHWFGFGENAPTDIMEQTPGLIPDSSYFNRTYPQGWTVGYSINLGIGQGNMGVTPLQLARYVAAVANGGTLHPPHLVDRMVHPETGDVLRPKLPPSQKIPIDKEYFDIVRFGMRRMMEAGTGRGMQIPGISAGGKTGTAQAPGGMRDNSLIIMFAPWDDPQIAVAVEVENAGFGASAAGPIATLMVEMYLTGQIAPTPQRQALLQRALMARSQPLPES